MRHRKAEVRSLRVSANDVLYERNMDGQDGEGSPHETVDDRRWAGSVAQAENKEKVLALKPRGLRW